MVGSSDEGVRYGNIQVFGCLAEEEFNPCHSLSAALKEANESLYWLEILVDLYPTHETPVELRNEAEELLKLLQSISRSSRQRTKSNNLNNPNNRTILFLLMGSVA